MYNRNKSLNNFYTKLSNDLQEQNAYDLLGVKPPMSNKSIDPYSLLGVNKQNLKQTSRPDNAKNLLSNISISENMKDVVKEADKLGYSPIGQSVYNGDLSDHNAEEIILDEQWVKLIRDAILQEQQKEEGSKFLTGMTSEEKQLNDNSVSMLNRFDNVGFKVEDFNNIDHLTYAALKTIYQLGDKAIGKMLAIPNKRGDKFIKLNSAMVNAGKKAISWLLKTNNTNDLDVAIRNVMKKSAHLGAFLKNIKVAGKTNPVDTFYNIIKTALFKVTAEEDFDSLIVSKDELDSELNRQSDSVANEETLVTDFLKLPQEETFQKLLAYVNKTLGPLDSTERRQDSDVTTELLTLFNRYGYDWITEDNIIFLYELYSI